MKSTKAPKQRVSLPLHSQKRHQNKASKVTVTKNLSTTTKKGTAKGADSDGSTVSEQIEELKRTVRKKDTPTKEKRIKQNNSNANLLDKMPEKNIHPDTDIANQATNNASVDTVKEDSKPSKKRIKRNNSNINLSDKTPETIVVPETDAAKQITNNPSVTIVKEERKTAPCAYNDFGAEVSNNYEQEFLENIQCNLSSRNNLSNIHLKEKLAFLIEDDNTSLALWRLVARIIDLDTLDVTMSSFLSNSIMTKLDLSMEVHYHSFQEDFETFHSDNEMHPAISLF